MARVTNLWRVVQHWLDKQQFPPNQSALAKALGVQRSAVSDWKSGKTRPTPEHLHKLSVLMEPTLGPMAYTMLVMSMMTDMGFGEWRIGDEKRLPPGARLEYIGGPTYGVFHGLVYDAETDSLEAKDQMTLAADQDEIDPQDEAEQAEESP